MQGCCARGTNLRAQDNLSKEYAHTSQSVESWKQGPPKHSSKEQLKKSLEIKLNHKAEEPTQETGLGMNYPQCKFKVQQQITMQTDQPSISQEDTEGLSLKLQDLWAEGMWVRVPGEATQGC